MAASNKLRVTSSHSMQPTTGLHRWHVHISTYGRSVASKPAAIACDRGVRPPCSSDRIECFRSRIHDISVASGIPDRPSYLSN